MRKCRTGIIAAVIGAVALPLAVPTAQAAQSVTSGTATCTVEALAPKVAVTSKGRTLTGQARVWCTASTTVSVRLYVSELDGTVEQISIPEAARSVSVRGSTLRSPVWVTLTTSTVTCPNTEVGNEEFRSNARITLGMASTDYDRTAPTNDQFAC